MVSYEEWLATGMGYWHFIRRTTPGTPITLTAPTSVLEFSSGAPTLTVIIDTAAPTVTLMYVPEWVGGAAVPVTVTSPSSDTTGYILSAASTPPTASDPSWSATPPTTYAHDSVAAVPVATDAPLVTAPAEFHVGQIINVEVQVPVPRAGIRAFARDRAGNVGASAQMSFKVDRTETPSVSAPNGTFPDETFQVVVDVPPRARFVTKLVLHGAATTGGVLQGSNDNSTWTTIQNITPAGAEHEESIGWPFEYRWYRYTGTATSMELWHRSSNLGSRAFTPAGGGIGLDVGYEETHVVFTTTGSTFAPVIQAAVGASVQWVWDGGSADGLTPALNFGSAAVREVHMHATPANAVTMVNVGYDAGDNGSTAYPLLAQQNVSAIEGLRTAVGLQILCVSNNPIQALDVGGCESLTHLEGFHCTSLRSVNLKGCYNALRLCFEDNDLRTLDLSDCPLVEDLRGSNNYLPFINWGPAGGAGARSWHICVMNSPMTEQMPLSRFGVVRDLWIAGNHQTGACVIRSSALRSVWLAGNLYTSLDVANQFPAGRASELLAGNNRLTSVDITGCPGLNNIQLTGNQLPEAQVDAVLVEANAWNTSGAYALSITGTNAAPSATGAAAATALRGRGWTVNHN